MSPIFRWPCASCTKKRRKIDGENLCSLIRKGIKTLDEVPARLRSTVKALLAEVEADA